MPDESSLLHPEMLDLPLKHSNIGRKVPIQNGAQRIVGKASSRLTEYAHSVEAELDCMESSTAAETVIAKRSSASTVLPLRDMDEEAAQRGQTLCTQSVNGREMPEHYKGKQRADEEQPPPLPTENWSLITQPSHEKPAEALTAASLPAMTESTLVDEAINSNIWGLMKSDLIDPGNATAKGPQLANCTASHESET